MIGAIILRSLSSWFAPDPRNPVVAFLHDITEPILGPLRQIVPRFGMLDLSPMIAIILLSFIGQVLSRSLS